MATAVGKAGEFDHARHAKLKLKCAACHTGAASKDRAGWPAASACKTCHVPESGGPAATMLASRKADESMRPAKLVYKLPDFVWFSHAKHQRALGENSCATCHGDVWTMSQIASPFRGLKMKDCVDCHKQHNATVTCTVCHELGQ